jgi:hypothetical protein
MEEQFLGGRERMCVMYKEKWTVECGFPECKERVELNAGMPSVCERPWWDDAGTGCGLSFCSVEHREQFIKQYPERAKKFPHLS